MAMPHMEIPDKKQHKKRLKQKKLKNTYNTYNQLLIENKRSLRLYKIKNFD